MSDTSPNSYELNTPKCEICSVQHKEEEFDSSAWIQGADNSDCVNNPEGNAKIIWICPGCSKNIGYTQIKDDLIRLQNACAEILEAGKRGQQCGH